MIILGTNVISEQVEPFGLLAANEYADVVTGRERAGLPISRQGPAGPGRVISYP